MNTTKTNKTQQMVFASIFLALSLLLPFLTGHIPYIGRALLPMHLPILLCGFVCGPIYGLFVGAISPILRSVLFGMPPLFPVAISMAFELAAYGFFTGLLYKKLKHNTVNIYISLIVSMILGRIVWGAVQFILALLFKINFGFKLFFAGAFINAIPGIIVQIILIPIIVITLRKTKWLS